MAKKSLDLSTLLPNQYRDKTIDTIFKNLFNRHVSKNDTIPLFGYVGDGELTGSDIGIQEESLERQVNQITSLIYAEHSTEKKVFSWPDLVQKLVLLGVNYDRIDEWFNTRSYNFVPPIDIDKFCNFSEYFWIGEWVKKSPNLPYHELGLRTSPTSISGGIPSDPYISNVFPTSNPEYLPEYYMIARGELTERALPNSTSVEYAPVSPSPKAQGGNLITWTEWALTNLWVHKEDLIRFLDSYGNMVSFNELTQASRPIIEFSHDLRINTHQLASAPAESGFERPPRKTRRNQPPLFDLYTADGQHSGYTSALFYYVEGSEYSVDPFIERRIATDKNNDYTFEHALAKDDGEILFFKTWNGSKFDLGTIWKNGPYTAPDYVKYDDSGSIINIDKFVNYRNYFWTGAGKSNLPIYNLNGVPEYSVIESDGTSAWAAHNYWHHVNQIDRSDLGLYHQAQRPIIEFNKILESELIVSKTYLNELPRFKMYGFDTPLQAYTQIPSSSIGSLNDAYLNGLLLVRIEDLEPTLQEVIRKSPEMNGMILQTDSGPYIQNLITGRYVDTKDNIYYGFQADVTSLLDITKGEVVNLSISPNCTPEVITLKFNSAFNSFSVNGSVTGFNSEIAVGDTVTVSGITFEVSQGIENFSDGDLILINIKSHVFESGNLFIQTDSVFKTITNVGDFLQPSENVNSAKIKTSPSFNDGAWEVPEQIEWNLHNETRRRIKEGDLYFHFSSIIGAQPNISGSETGGNNWRNLSSRNYGLGGCIKQYDDNVSLLISILIQEGITVSSIIEFAQQSYENLFTTIRTFIEDEIPDMLSDVAFDPPVQGDYLDGFIVDKFRDYFKQTSSKGVFSDTTSPIAGLVATLPYLGLTNKVKPQKIWDHELNLSMLVHHDGHRSEMVKPNIDLLKRITTKKITRTAGQETSGFVTGVYAPTENPYKGQFWFQTSTNKLFFFNVKSDQGIFHDNPELGDFVYNRSTREMFIWSSTWHKMTTSDFSLPWTEVNLDLLEHNLILSLENTLYDQCPIINRKHDSIFLESHPDFIPYMQGEFEKFGVTYGVPDVYSSSYDSDNAFTWNYSSINSRSSWAEVYKSVYYTVRPDLEPWIPAGFADEQTLIASLRGLGLVPNNAIQWDIDYWTFPNVQNFLRNRYINNGLPSVFSVDIATGALLPPYSTEVEGLYQVVPTSASNIFPYGSLGPVETFWRKTTNYLYSREKVYFKINPLKYINNTWGVKYETIGGYKLNSSLSRKEAPKDFQLHGEPRVITSVEDKQKFKADIEQNIQTGIISFPLERQLYKFTCIEREETIFKVEINGVFVGFYNANDQYQDSIISIRVGNRFNYFYHGDSFTVDISPTGTYLLSYDLTELIMIGGLNELYVQYRRLFSEDSSLSINQTLLKDWTIKTGYRFGCLVNTDSLLMRNQNDALDTTSYDVLIKENKFYNSLWLNALRVQLVQRGSASNGQPIIGDEYPGEDWIFRVDNFNDKRTDISWYDYDAAGEFKTFRALDGTLTDFNWKKYQDPTRIISHKAPFLIRGIQHVINFINGYSHYLEDQGWRFNNDDNPILDETTGRSIGFQLLMEQFIAQQFSGVDAGSAFAFNPFSRKVWIKTDHGVVSDLFNVIGTEFETVCTILTQNQRPLDKDDVRVFRQDEITEIVFDRECYTLHALISEYEHIALFKNYSVDNVLVFDTFLGQRTDKIFISGDRQEKFTGRLDLGGHFLIGDQMKRNLEGSVSDILQLYDSNGKTYQTEETERARALLGFKKKEYFANRGSTDTTEFRFWQGMIGNKGTNFSIDAFINSSQFKTAELDEYWAYKIAEYGDAREIVKVELRVEPEDCISEFSNFLFLESNELQWIREHKRNAGFDATNLGITAFDVSTLYTEDQSTGFEFVDPSNSVIITPTNEDRWHRYSDLNSLEYFVATPIAEFRFIPDSADELYVIRDSTGNPVRADIFEIHDLDNEYIYYESGEFVNTMAFDTEDYDTFALDVSDGSHSNFDFSAPSFTRINHSTIQITNTLVGKNLKVIAYGPSFSRYSPSSLIDYKNNTTTKDDIIWWDPARGVHHPVAINEVDLVSDRDPAKYNRSLFKTRNSSIEMNKPWGEENVGRIWWNTKGLRYQPYSDTKIITDSNDRLSIWGSLSDSSSMEVYEWYKSDVPPSEFVKTEDVDGDAAIKHTLERNRTWHQRPVAWLHSSNPITMSRSFLAYNPMKLYIEVGVDTRGFAILEFGDIESINLEIDSKIAAVTYTSDDKNVNEITKISGTVIITSESAPVIGSKTDYNQVAFNGNEYFDITASIDGEYKKDFLGEFNVSNEQDGNDYYIRLTHKLSGMSQRLVSGDYPVTKGTQVDYVFDTFGITFHAEALKDRIEYIDSTALWRSAVCAAAIGHPAHDIVIRSMVEIEMPIPFNMGERFTLNGPNELVSTGWIAWNDPTTNPNVEFAPPLNNYEPMVGDWMMLTGQLAEAAPFIQERLDDPWTWFDGENYNPYKSEWGVWKPVESLDVERRYNPKAMSHEDYMKTEFIFANLSVQELRERAVIYVNESKIHPSNWKAEIRANGPFIIGVYPNLSNTNVNLGDSVRVVIMPPSISDDDLKFNPEVNDDIFKMNQYKIDFPYVYEITRDINDSLQIENYYFWIKNKSAPSKLKKLSIKNISNKLHWHDDTFGIPQIMKQYDQKDGRPNRYAMLSIKNLSANVVQAGMYKLRITNNPTLRNSDNDLDLKNTHTEWVLIRPGQPTRISKLLWDKLTETLIGKTAVGDRLLPFSVYEKYDERNNSTDRYGFKDGQIVADINTTIITVKHTILNTKVDKYVSEEQISDEISFEGFESDVGHESRSQHLDQIFSNETDIRKFMSDLWRFAKPKQINEIFFAVLEDAASKDLEMTDFFKTSFISLGEIRTVQSSR